MKQTKYILSLVILLGIVFSIMPVATPQIGTYTFHGAAGNEKILKVRTANNASLEIVFGAGYATILENAFGAGALQVGAMKKSLVTDVNFTYKSDLTFFGLGIHDAAQYNTSNWGWTLGSFNSTPDSVGDLVTSLYDPTNITLIVNGFFGTNVTIQNGAAYFAQLPTPVAQYLGAIVWQPKWENVGNTVVHHAQALDWHSLAAFQYQANCTETWSYDATYGAWIGYKIEANSTTIYEFSIELTIPGIPGFEISILSGASIIAIVYIIKRKKFKN
jgi:hypothetical protein